MRYELTVWLAEFLGAEYAVDVTYTYKKGSPMKGPSWMSPGDPAIDPEIEIEHIDLHEILGLATNEAGELTFSSKGRIRYRLSPILECPAWLEAKIRAWILEESFDQLCDEAELDRRAA